MLQFEWIASEEENGRSAGDALRKRFLCSASLVKEIRLRGDLQINGCFARMKTPLKPGDHVLATAEPDIPVPELNLTDEHEVLYQSPWLLAVSKKPGQVVHRCLNHELEDICSRICPGQTLHPVNRLDRDTSGIVLIALNGHAHYLMSLQRMHKKYLALVHGRFPEQAGRIEQPIGRSQDSLILREIREDGKPAATLWKEIQYSEAEDISLMEFELLTGRTHQIRVHSLYAGHPLVGDDLYGVKRLEELVMKQKALPFSFDSEAALHIDHELGRQALHAAFLSFNDPQTKERIVCSDPLPDDMQQIMQNYFPPCQIRL